MYTDIKTGGLQADFKKRLLKFHATILSVMVVETIAGWLHVEFGDIEMEAFIIALVIRLVALVIIVICTLIVVCSSKARNK
jgi:hypothetical protein